MTTAPVESPRRVGPARERILGAAYELFSQRGIQAVGIDAIIERSGVARQTLYRHFGSKQELVLAFLERREELWTSGWLQAEVERRAANPPSACWRSSTSSTSGSPRRLRGLLVHQRDARAAESRDPIRQAASTTSTASASSGGARGRGRRPRSRRLRAQVAHPHEGLDRRRGRGRREAGKRAQQVAGLLLRESNP